MERLKIELSRELSERVQAHSRSEGSSPHSYVARILEEHVAPPPDRSERRTDAGLEALRAFLARIPGVRVMSSAKQSGRWWVKLGIDIDSPFAWHVVQELGFVLNYISLTELLPTVFKPVSSPPYLNGGPRDYLGWVIESTQSMVDPAGIAAILEERLPNPVEDVSQWKREEEE